ncbi:MAG: M56 family metallopeptidase [Acidobacteriota bacterium]|nr:M56 family metallopeptidase [Acidobacteriota bacterium]
MLLVVENFVLFSTCLALVCFALAWAARATARHGQWNPPSYTLTRLYAALLFAPPLFAAWIVAAAFIPETWLGKASFDAAHLAPLHEMHLLGDVTVKFEPTLAYTTFTFFIAAAIFAAWSSARGSWRVGRVIQKLEMSATAPSTEQIALVERIAQRENLDVGLVMSDYPFSFVWGFRRSKLVLSSGLLRTLNADELTGVLEHEAAHHARRDNMTKLLLLACSYASLAFPLSRLLLRWRAEEVELICDEVATARTTAPLDIADALVKLHRQALMPVASSSSGVPAVGFAPHDTLNFERRVHRLIAFADATPDPARAVLLTRTRYNGVVVITALFVSSLLLLSLTAPLAVHHATETLIQLIK